MTRFRPLLLLLLILLPFASAQGQAPTQSVPSQIALALASLSQRLTRPITLIDLDSWSFQQNLYTDTALGCPYAVGTARPEGISGYTFTLVFQGMTYEYRVAADGSLTFACDQSLAHPQPTSQATNCPVDFAGYLPPRLQVGGLGRIGISGTANRLRDQPSVNGTQVGLIQPGSTVPILEGPVCEEASHIIWWRVDDNGVVGWTAEGGLPGDYFLSPVSSSLPLERDLITSSNVDTLIPLATISLAGVSSLSFPQDGTLLALGGLSGLAVYDMSTQTQRAALSDITAPVTAVAFSPDGRYLAYSTQDGALFVFDVLSARRATLSQVTHTRIDNLAFSLDTRYLLASGSGSPTNAPGIPTNWQVHDLPNQQVIASGPTPTWVRGVAFSPDGARFAWMDTAVHVIDVANGAPVRTFALEEPPVGGLAWRPVAATAPLNSLQVLAFADGTQIRLADLAANTEQTFSGDAGFFPGALAFNADGSLLAAMNVPNDTTTTSIVNIFDATTGDLITSTPLQASSAISFSPDGTLLVIASNDEVLFLGIGQEQQPEQDVAVG